MSNSHRAPFANTHPLRRSSDRARIAADQFLGSYVDAYRRTSDTAVREHPSLVGIYECDDDIFYDPPVLRRFEWLSLGHLTPVILQSVNSSLNQGECCVGSHLKTQVGGHTYVLTDGNHRHTAILMRRDTGLTHSDRALAHMFKLASLFHELGHVSDFERGINYTYGPRHKKCRIGIDVKSRRDDKSRHVRRNAFYC